MLANAGGPVIAQLDPLDDQQSPNTHHPTDLEDGEVARLDVVDQQVLDEVGHGEGVEEDAVDLRAVAHSEYDRGDGGEDAQMPAVADVGQDDVHEVDLLHAGDVGDGEGQDCVEDAEAVVDGLEG